MDVTPVYIDDPAHGWDDWIKRPVVRAGFDYDESQHPRDEHGRWDDGSGTTETAGRGKSGGEDAHNASQSEQRIAAGPLAPSEIRVPDDMPKEIAGRVQAQLSKLSEQYMIGPTGVTWGTNAYATSGRDTILLNKDFWSDPARVAAWDSDFKGLAATTIEGVMTHEFGHAVVNSLGRDYPADREKVDAIVDKLDPHYTTPYGQENSSENGAELFAAHVIGLNDENVWGTIARPDYADFHDGQPSGHDGIVAQAAALGDILDGHYKR